MAHFIGIKQPNGQISPVMDFENSKPVKLNLTPVRDKQDKVFIPFYYVDTENREYTIPLGSFTIRYKKKSVQDQEKMVLSLKLTGKGKLKVALMSPMRKATTFDVFKHLKKKQRSQKMELSRKLKSSSREQGAYEHPGPEGEEHNPALEQGARGRADKGYTPRTTAETGAGKRAGGGLRIVLIAVYAVILLALIFFLLTQTFEELSLERLFGISL